MESSNVVEIQVQRGYNTGREDGRRSGGTLAGSHVTPRPHPALIADLCPRVGVASVVSAGTVSGDARHVASGAIVVWITLYAELHRVTANWKDIC